MQSSLRHGKNSKNPWIDMQSLVNSIEIHTIPRKATLQIGQENTRGLSTTYGAKGLAFWKNGMSPTRQIRGKDLKPPLAG
jgi:hypothetical protein